MRRFILFGLFNPCIFDLSNKNNTMSPQIQTLEQAESFIIFENDFKICVKESKDAANWISQRELDKGGTGGATYGPYKTQGVVYYEIYKDGALEADTTIPNIVIK